MNARALKWACALALVLGSSGAMAATDWSAGFSGCATYSTSTTTVTCTDTAGVTPVTVSAVGTDNYASGSIFTLRDINYYTGGGLGVKPLGSTESTPEHAIDNNNWIDAVVIKFDSSVILNEVTLGWRYQDWDFSVFAFTGSGQPLNYNPISGATTLTSPTMALNSTLGGGWTLVSNYGTAGGCSPTSCDTDLAIAGLNSGNVSSSWWVISAYSDAYGTTKLAGTSTPGIGSKDYFKLLKVAGNYYTPPPPPPPTGVTEPGSLALAGLAFFGVIASRRRKVRTG